LPSRIQNLYTSPYACYVPYWLTEFGIFIIFIFFCVYTSYFSPIIDTIPTPRWLIRLAGQLSTEHIQRCMNVNFFGNVHAIQAVLPIMKRQSTGGRIISVSSVLGLFGCMGYSAYGPSKAAIVNL